MGLSQEEIRALGNVIADILEERRLERKRGIAATARQAKTKVSVHERISVETMEKVYALKDVQGVGWGVHAGSKALEMRKETFSMLVKALKGKLKGHPGKYEQLAHLTACMFWQRWYNTRDPMNERPTKWFLDYLISGEWARLVEGRAREGVLISADCRPKPL